MDPLVLQPNLILVPTGLPQSISSVQSATSLTDIDDGVIVTDEMLDHGVASAYGQRVFTSSWDGGMDIRVLERKRFRSHNGQGTKFDGVRERDAVYLHCIGCDTPV